MPNDRDDSLNMAAEADEVLQLNTEITQMSDEEFEKLMSGEEAVEAPSKPTTPTPTPTPKEQYEKPPKEKEAPAPSTKPKPKPAPPPKEEEEKEDEDIGELEEFGEEEEKPRKPATAPSTGKAAEPEDEDDETTKQVLSSTYQHLVKTGLWREVEGEDFDPDDISSETYAQIAVQQANEAAHEAFEELMDRTGRYRSILDHALRNGNPDEIINLFKEEHHIQSLDTKMPTDQKEIIRKYYKDLMEWESDDVENFINKAEADNELEKYANISRKGYQKHIDTAVATKNNELKAREIKAQQDKQTFIDTMSEVIDGLKTSSQEREFLKRAVFAPAFKVSPEKTITGFQAQMLRIQQNPTDYLDLIRFVMDKQRYIDQLTVKKENKEVQQKFKLNLGGSTASASKGSEIPAKRKTSSKEQEDLQFFAPSK